MFELPLQDVVTALLARTNGDISVGSGSEKAELPLFDGKIAPLPGILFEYLKFCN